MNIYARNFSPLTKINRILKSYGKIVGVKVMLSYIITKRRIAIYGLYLRYCRVAERRQVNTL